MAVVTKRRMIRLCELRNTKERNLNGKENMKREKWDQIPAFVKIASFVKNMPITNDLSERLVRRTVMYMQMSGQKESLAFKHICSLLMTQLNVAHHARVFSRVHATL